MDKTRGYILKSEKAIEMQARWKPQDGDWFAIKKDLISEGEHYALKGEICQVAYLIRSRIYFPRYTGANSEPKMVTYHLQYLHEPKRFKLTWLPTQSQLQGMLKKRTGENQKYNHTYIGDEHLESFTLKCVLMDFFRWAKEEGIDYLFTSLEQFWLAFYMHEVYKKNWDNERGEWVYLTRRERVGLYSPLTV